MLGVRVSSLELAQSLVKSLAQSGGSDIGRGYIQAAIDNGILPVKLDQGGALLRLRST